ncbi:glycine-rich domain-containing protein [Atlantibacter hermannii]|uniref:glycine-rich domain-containing protein n=1 Tax=Atlantibacter hermannii TaxID=565 RepID=UPI0028A0D6D1|nr:hypothetical protein [Atlantibacter hermannii]
MSKIERYAGNLRAFGSNAQGLERTLFGETTQADDLTSQVTAAFLRGWGIVGPSENPSLEDFNAAMYAMSQFIAYQHQMGVPEWDAAQEYYKGSLCIRGGETYSSLVDNNIGSAPPSAKWTQLLSAKNSLSEIATAGTAPQARANLGFDALGFGLSNNALLSAFDWQQVDFTTGARYLVSSSTWTNAPSGVNYPAGTQVFISVDGITSAGTVIELTLIANQANDANYRIYKVRVANAKGSRTFTVRQIFTSSDVIPTANIDAPGRLLGAPKVLATSGSYTPGANVKAIVVEIVGGGAGGGYAKASQNFNAAGGGGGAGGYSKKYIPITSQTPIPYTVGQGGTGAVVDAGAYGQSGGATTFGTGFSASGGTGGSSAISISTSTSVGSGGSGGIGAGGDINSRGGPGQAGVSEKPSVAGGTTAGGPGGSSIISGQGGPGGGGQGGSGTANGNRANDGAVIIWELA